MLSDIDLARQFDKHRKASNSGLSLQYKSMRECQEFYSGDIMQYADKIQYQDNMGRKRRAMVQFNKVKPYVNAVKGFMAQNRRKAKYIARVPNDQAMKLYSDYSNAMADYIRDEANADQIETQADSDMLVGGYGAVETAMTYGLGQATTDPNGQILMGRVDPLTVFWDPYARETNLLDSRWCGYKKDYALDDAMELFDDHWEDHFEQADADFGEVEGYRFYERGGRYNKIRESSVDWADADEDLVKVYFYQWFEYETFYRADNPIYTLTNPQAVQLAAAQLDIIAQEMDEEDKDLFAFDPRAEILTFDEKIKARLIEHFGQFLKNIFDYKRRVYYSAVISKDHVFTKYRSTCQQGFTLKFKTGDYDAKNNIWTGMVTSMKDPVMYYNKALTELMFIIGANSKGGVLVEETAVEDIQKFEQQYAKTDAVVVVNDGAIQNNKIRDKRSPYTPTGYENIIQLSDASISDVNGIDKTFLGSSENKQETGLLQRRRIRQVVSALACYFDSVTLYQKEHARLLLDFMRIYAENNAGGLFRILGENGRQEYLQISADKLCAQYDVEIQEAMQTPEEKQEFATIISGMGDKLLAVDPQTAKMFYAIAVKYLPIDQSDQQRMLQILMPQDQKIDPAYVQQLEQQVKSLMSEVTQADVKKKLSEVALNAARTDEMTAKVHETLAKATKTEMDAVKAQTEASIMQHAPDQNTRVVI